jgi:hypothetical protein
MGYTFNCDHCDGRYDRAPPFMGEFTERFLKTRGGDVAEDYEVGETVTLCASCSREFFL